MTTIALDQQIIHAVCPHDCPDTCSMLVTVQDGKAIKIQGNPEHPITNGFLCTKVSRYVERTYHQGRLLYPAKRVGPKGAGQFERISWDEALTTIAECLQAISTSHGPQSILPYSYAGTMGLLHYGSMDRRFFHRLGASLLDRTICASAGATGYRYTVGASVGTDPEAYVDAKLIILWGTNTLTSNVHLWTFIKAARKAGARVIAIDPWRSRTAAQCDWHIAPLPGTDAALALGMMHIIFRDGLQDQAYLDEYCLGGEQLLQRVQEYPPELVAELTGLDVATIEQLAHEYATTAPAAIRINYGLQRHAGGGMAVRTLACLPAVIGSWRERAGGILLSTSGTFPINNAALERPDLIPAGTRMINMNQLGDALTELNDPPVQALFVYNSNPASVAPDLEAVKRGLEREDLFTVVHEQFYTDTTRYADIILPATTQLEHVDLHKAYGHWYLAWSNQAIEPLGEAIPNTELFRRLAAKMGFSEPCFSDDDQTIARQALNSNHPALAGITLERLQEAGWLRLNVPSNWAPFAEGNFLTPSGKCELYSERMLADGFDPLPTYTAPYESPVTNPRLAERYPLTLISPPAHHFLNSTFGNILQRYESGPTLEINPLDAIERNIDDGDQVLIRNDRGGFVATAVVTDRVRQAVVVAPSIWWSELTVDGRNVNHTTPQALSDMGGGATFYDNLVEVERIVS